MYCAFNQLIFLIQCSHFLCERAMYPFTWAMCPLEKQHLQITIIIIIYFAHYEKQVGNKSSCAEITLRVRRTSSSTNSHSSLLPKSLLVKKLHIPCSYFLSCAHAHKIGGRLTLLFLFSYYRRLRMISKTLELRVEGG